MIMEDDRKGREKYTHCNLIGGVDTFLSGWGKAENGLSWAFWACRDKDKENVWTWVKNRGDIKHTRERGKDYRPSAGKHGHFHVYVVHEGHNSLK